jgi:hypothetical protein
MVCNYIRGHARAAVSGLGAVILTPESVGIAINPETSNSTASTERRVTDYQLRASPYRTDAIDVVNAALGTSVDVPQREIRLPSKCPLAPSLDRRCSCAVRVCSASAANRTPISMSDFKFISLHGCRTAHRGGSSRSGPVFAGQKLNPDERKRWMSIIHA